MFVHFSFFTILFGVWISVESAIGAFHPEIQMTGQIADCKNPSYKIIESIPQNVNITAAHEVYKAWIEAFRKATKSIDIAAFYFSLTDGKEWPPSNGGWMGQAVFDQLVRALQRNVTIRIAQNEPSESMPDNDTRVLASKGAIVRSVRWKEFFNGSGLLHTKLFVVDGLITYIGSANYDWRSLSQVKELGVMFYDCEQIALEVKKIFEMYWMSATIKQLPVQWPSTFDTVYNQQNPLTIKFKNEEEEEESHMYFASSPRQFCPPNRTEDLVALLSVINNAQEFILVSVMDYSPTTLYQKPNSYWPLIDDALRTAAFCRHVKVRLMFSLWNYTIPWTLPFMSSLAQLDHVEVRLFKVPDLPNQKQIPYTRVNHSKYMITEKQVYIGTSNWSADYFEWTAGLSVVWSNEKIVRSMKEIFYRDWDSQYIIKVNRTLPPLEILMKYVP